MKKNVTPILKSSLEHGYHIQIIFGLPENWNINLNTVSIYIIFIRTILFTYKRLVGQPFRDNLNTHKHTHTQTTNSHHHLPFPKYA